MLCRWRRPTCGKRWLCRLGPIPGQLVSSVQAASTPLLAQRTNKDDLRQRDVAVYAVQSASGLVRDEQASAALPVTAVVKRANMAEIVVEKSAVDALHRRPSWKTWWRAFCERERSRPGDGIWSRFGDSLVGERELVVEEVRKRRRAPTRRGTRSPSRSGRNSSVSRRFHFEIRTRVADRQVRVERRERWSAHSQSGEARYSRGKTVTLFQVSTEALDGHVELVHSCHVQI